MQPFLGPTAGNPSSLHQAGRAARGAIDDARDALAGVLGCSQGEVVFTSGGTEANNLALRGVLAAGADRGQHVVISAVEHEAVSNTCADLARHGVAEITVIGCDSGGRVDPGEVAAAVRPDTVVVSVMLVNNEVGTVQDLSAIASAVKDRNPVTVVHTDAAQALGRLPIAVASLGVDLMTLSAHKAYGPKGAGALYVRRGVVVGAQITGGGQERGRRSGTENVPAIVGFGVAAPRAEARRDMEMARQRRLAERLRERVVALVPDVRLCGSTLHSVAGIITFAFADVRSEVLVTALDRLGVCASGGSACSSGATLPSHVLAAMGVESAYVSGPLRCSLGEQTTEEDIDRAVIAIGQVVTPELYEAAARERQG